MCTVRPGLYEQSVLCALSYIAPTFKSHWVENSSMIMILLHARGFIRSVLSTGSQHFSYMTQGGTYIETGKCVFIELGGGKNNQKMMQTASWLLSSDVSFLFLL